MEPMIGSFTDEMVNSDYDYVPDDFDCKIEKEIRKSEKKNAEKAIEWEIKGEENLNIMYKAWIDARNAGKDNTNIGERIRFLREINNLTLADVYVTAGVSKNTLLRYQAGTTRPKIETLRAIIKALYSTVGDFCYSPDDTEKWKAAFIDDGRSRDIFRQISKLKETFDKGDFYYTSNEEKVRLPYRYLDILRDMVATTEKILSTIEHD